MRFFLISFICVCFCCNAFGAVNVYEGKKLYFDCDVMGIEVQDLSVLGNDGWNTDYPNWVSGYIGYGLQFYSVGDIINVYNEQDYDFERTDSFSVAAWVKIAETTVEEPIFSKEGAGPLYTGWAFYVEPGGLCVFLTNKNNFPHNQVRKDSSVEVDDGLWHFCVFTYNGSSLAVGVNIYVDGQLANGSVLRDSLSASILNNSQVQVGGLGTALYNHGVVDELSIYYYELSSDDVLALYDEYVFVAGATPVPTPTCAVGGEVTEEQKHALALGLAGCGVGGFVALAVIGALIKCN